MRLPYDPERKIIFIIAEGATALDAAGPLEVFATAGSICETRGFQAPYSVVLASAYGGIVKTRTGLEILTRRLDDFAGREIDTVIVAGRGTNGAEEEVTIVWLRQNEGFLRRLCSVCVGAFVLARSGLLEGRAATTHWGSLESLATDFPATRVESGTIFVRDGKVWTAAGVLAGVDLALQLVEDDLGEELAMRIAKILVIFVRRSADHPQHSAMLEMQATVDSDFSDLVRWMGDNLARHLHVEDLASRAGMTPRTFARRFKAATGTTPSNAVARLRIEAAKQIMATKRRSMKEVAAIVGFKTEINLRRALQKTPPVTSGRHRDRLLANPLSPRKQSMTIGNVQSEVSRFWSRSASSFDARASHVVQAEPWQHVLAAAFQADAPKDVVDLGTGTGACAIIAARLGHRVRGYDGSDGMLEAAKRAAVAAGVDVTFINGVIEHAPIEPASADIVTLRNVLWTVEDPHSVLRRARDVLRPDGLIVISDGVWAAAPGFRSTYAEELEMRLPYHAGLGEDEARALLRQAGFGEAQSWQHLFVASPYPNDVPMFVLTAHRSQM